MRKAGLAKADKKSGRIRGLYMTIANAGWLLAPFLATRLLSRSGFPAIFLVGLTMYAVILSVVLIGFRGGINRSFSTLQDIRPERMLKRAFRDKHILRIYAVACCVEFFYAIMIVYASLYLLSLGFGWDAIGIVFTVMLVPFVMIQYPLGALADKRFGEKEMLIAFLAIMIVSTASVPYVASVSLWTCAAIFFATRVGAAGVDILRESYFYKRIDATDVDMIAFFRTARPVATITAAAFTAVALRFFPLSSVFWIASAVLVAALVPAFALVDSKSEVGK
jgi:predicted MFS family arabinose efflux permease